MKKVLSLFSLWMIANVLLGQDTDSLTVAKQVDSLLKVSRELIDQRDFEKAMEISMVAEKLAMDRFGRESGPYASCHANHGRVLYSKGEYTEAEKWSVEALGIREKALGKEHIQYASSLNNLATLYMRTVRYEKAEPLYLEAKAIREKVLGKEHPTYATTLNNIANLYTNMGRYEKAEPYYLETKAIREKVYGKEHPDYIQSVNNLAALHTSMGRYEKAELLYLEANTLAEKTLGKKDTTYAMYLYNLADLYMRMGRYEKAELLHLEAIDIREKASRTAHPNYGWSLNDLANLYMHIGQYEKAELLYLEAKAVWEKASGKEHPTYARSLNNLARFYISMGQYEKAEPFHLDAKAIRKKALGTEHPDYAESLNDLANLYTHLSQYEKAELLHFEAKAVWEKALGKQHSDYARSLNNLARLYVSMGQYEKAEPLYLEAKAIWEEALGTQHPYYAESLNNLAKLYMLTGHDGKAEPLCLELSATSQTLMGKALRYLSERELNGYLNTFAESQNLILSFVQRSGSKKATAACYDNSLFYKSFLLNAAGQLNRLAHTDATATAEFDRMKGYRRRLAALYALPIAERDSAIVLELETQANELEKDLARTIAGYGAAMQQVKWDEVRAALKPNEVAIEFTRFQYWNKKPTDSILYAALLLRPTDEAPHFIYLCTEAQLQTVLGRWDDKNLATSPAEVYWPKQGGASLYDLLWKPLKALLPKGITIWYAPAGLLHRLNLDAVELNRNTSLADRYTLRRIGSTRQIALPPTAKSTGKEAALFGGLRYESDTLAILQSNASLALATRHVDERKPASPDGTRSLRDSLYYLTNSRTEVESISKRLKTGGFNTSLFIDYGGTEEAFLQTSGSPLQPAQKLSPRILHIATHGYFFPDPKEDSTALKNLVGMERHIPYRASDNPFIRSGLLLSGSEHAWRTGTPASAKLADGILTAADIAAMDLSNTELAVLSACQTGLGDVEANEGVYGLQRAFKIAGARYLIMSLWKVSDAATMELMTAFYAKWLNKQQPMSIPDAFRAAQTELRVKYRDPFLWAGFVLVE